MFGIRPGELAVIAIVALIIFGPKRLPELARAFGQSISEFKRGTQEISATMRQEMAAGEQKTLEGQSATNAPASLPTPPNS